MSAPRLWGGVSLADQWDEIENVSKSAQLLWDTVGLVWVKATTVQAVDLRRGQTILYAPIDVAASGDNIIVAADPTKKIKVVSYTYVADGTVKVRWKRGATAMSGAMSWVVNTGVSPPMGSPATGSIFETGINEDLIMNLDVAIGVRGHMSYYLEA